MWGGGTQGGRVFLGLETLELAIFGTRIFNGQGRADVLSTAACLRISEISYLQLKRP